MIAPADALGNRGLTQKEDQTTFRRFALLQLEAESLVLCDVKMLSQLRLPLVLPVCLSEYFLKDICDCLGVTLKSGTAGDCDYSDFD